MSTGLPDLAALAALPLDRIVISACCRPDDEQLGPVGGMVQKAKAAQQPELNIVALGVAKHQPDTPKGGSVAVVEAETLTELVSGLCQRLPDIYGEILDLPTGLEGNTGSAYAAQDFQPFPWLDAKIAEALQRQSQGYIFIEGGPVRGKTSWALHWQRASAGVQPGLALPAKSGLPALSAWFFARRYGVGNGRDNPYLLEENALQTLISLARLRWQLPPQEKEDRLLWNDRPSYRYDQLIDQSKLSKAFREALAELTTTPTDPALLPTASPRPTAEHPLILLLDGADELWGFGDGTLQPRTVFPDIFPPVLPPHTYVVFLSRPGQHLRGQDQIQPILHYQFSADDIKATLTDFLGNVAAGRLSGANPQQPSFDPDIVRILRDPVFQQHVREASKDAFGYVIGLIRYLSRLAPIEQLTELQRWQRHPESLPQDEYEQRAQELLGLCEALLNKYGYSIAQQVTLRRALAQVLASLALLQQPLTADGLVELALKPQEDSEQAMHVKKLLEGVHPFFMPKPPIAATDAEKTNDDGCTAPLYRLVFDHPLTAELALAYWRLMQIPNGLPDRGKGRWKAIGEHAKSVELRRADRLQNTPIEYLAAEALLHRQIGECSARYWSAFATGPRPQPVPDSRADGHRYALVWGPYHALRGASQKAQRPYDTIAPSPAAIQALELLLHAGYLQTAVRVAGRDSENALRQSYRVADEVLGAAENQSLRNRIESAVLEWHENLVDGSLQVGALLWNLLGGWEPAQDRAAHWKTILDQPALVTALPGKPMDLTRRLNGYNRQALSPCGQWLVTTGPAGATVWDLRQGAHRLHPVAQLPNWHTEELCCTAVDNTLYLLGGGGQLLWVGLVDLRSGAAVTARYAGHTGYVTSVALHVAGAELIGLSGSGDDTVGVLHVPDVRTALAHLPHDAPPQEGRLRRYAGHTGYVTSVALHVAGAELIGLSGSGDGTVGVLHVPDVRAALARLPPNTIPQKGRLRRYAGHTRPVRSVALHVAGAELIGLSGSGDDTVGVLHVPDVRTALAHLPHDAPPQEGRLLRYAGHTDTVRSVALHVAGAELIGLSGSFDGTVGVLHLPDVRAALARLPHDATPQEGHLMCFAGHTDTVRSVALHVAGAELIGLSGSDDRTVGVLHLPDVRAALAQTPHDDTPQEGRLIRYAGHTSSVTSVALHVAGTELIGLSGSWDDTVGVLHLPDVRAALAQTPPDTTPQEGRLIRYAGHTQWVNSVALHVAGAELIGLSGSDDRTVGVLHVPDVRAALARTPHDATPQEGHLRRYRGHTDTVRSVALHVAGAELIGLSGSFDGTVGVLHLPDVHAALARPPHDTTPQAGRLRRFAGHTSPVTSVALHVAGAELIGLSGSDDRTVGVLRFSRDRLAHLPPKTPPQAGRLIRYAGHTGGVWSVALHVAGAELIGLSGSDDRTVGVLHVPDVRLSHDATPPQEGRIARYARYTDGVGFIAVHANERPEEHIQKQAQSEQPDDSHALRSIRAMQYAWRSGSKVASGDEGTPAFWGFDSHAIIKVTVKSAAENSPRLVFDKVCPFYEPYFDPHDLVQLDEQTMVVGGASGNDIALLLLKWVRPD